MLFRMLKVAYSRGAHVSMETMSTVTKRIRISTRISLPSKGVHLNFGRSLGDMERPLSLLISSWVTACLCSLQPFCCVVVCVGLMWRSVEGWLPVLLGLSPSTTESFTLVERFSQKIREPAFWSLLCWVIQREENGSISPSFSIQPQVSFYVALLPQSPPQSWNLNDSRENIRFCVHSWHDETLMCRGVTLVSLFFPLSLTLIPNTVICCCLEYFKTFCSALIKDRISAQTRRE